MPVRRQLSEASLHTVRNRGSAGIPENLRKNYKTQFLPRFGFAYRLSDKTTVRGSYGLRCNMALLGSIFFAHGYRTVRRALFQQRRH